jgi:hypothetical protein
MSLAGFDPAILATKRPKTYALDRAATGITLTIWRGVKMEILNSMIGEILS